jgi:DNA-binding LytR/AlgR family response regulator
MLRIVICDDEPAQVDYLKALVSDWTDGISQSAEILCFDSAEALLYAWEQQPAMDILLLDVQLTGMDGITLARRLRKMQSACQIIFITAYEQHMAQGYEVEAVHYLIKPVAPEKLNTVLSRALERIQTGPGRLVFQTQQGLLALPRQETLYLEVFSHVVELHAQGGVYRLTRPIQALESELGADFFRCHRSYLVALWAVRRISRGQLLLTNGKVLPLSRQRYDAANLALMQYFKGERS